MLRDLGLIRNTISHIARGPVKRPRLSMSSLSRAPTISLDPTETKIRDLLVNFSKVFEKSQSEDVVLRITGGWVRDKLLGRQSHDIDIAINTCTGLVFAEALNEYIQAHAESLGMEPHSVHKIEKNPEKSKHLETATTKLYGLDIDFVNLRAEEYADEHSRIPSTIRFGTPEEDAFRRDATLNALFYNLQLGKVEDLTGRGLQDLEAKILRTPLPAFQTFSEDPLRVLRLIRFSSTFDFAIEQSAREAMMDERIRDAIIRKISRERVGVEISKILAGPSPQVGLLTIHDLDLEDSVFLLAEQFRTSPATKDVVDTPNSTLEPAVSLLHSLSNDPSKLHPLLGALLSDPKAEPSLYLCAALSHWGSTKAWDEKKKPASAANLIVRDGLKLSSNEAKQTADILSNAETVAEISKVAKISSRKDLGLFVRSCGQGWALCVLHGLIQESITGQPNLDDYNALVQAVVDHGIENAWNLKPLIDGKQIQKELGKPRGPWLSKALQKVIEFQLERPQATSTECLEYLKEIERELS